MALNNVIWQGGLGLRSLEEKKHTKDHENNGNEKAHDALEDHTALAVLCVIRDLSRRRHHLEVFTDTQGTERQCIGDTNDDLRSCGSPY